MDEKGNIVVITPGHTANNQGAVNSLSWLSEYPLAAMLCHDIKKDAMEKGITVMKYDNVRLISKVALINTLKPIFAIDIHFNAFDTTKKGPLFIFNPKYPTSRYLGELIMQKFVWSEVRQPISTKDTKRDYFVENCSCPAIVLELCFIDNNEDFLNYFNHYRYIKQAIINSAEEFIIYSKIGANNKHNGV